MPITSLSFTNVGPFDDVAFEFDPQVNVFVGPNNCGKSTVLFVMSNLIVRRFVLPHKLLRSESPTFRVGIRSTTHRAWHFDGTLPYIDKALKFAEVRGNLTTLAQFRKGLGSRTFVPALRWSTGYRSENPAGEHKKRLPPDVAHNASLIRDSQVVQDMIEIDYRAYRESKPAMRGIIDKIASIASQITEGFRIEFAGIAEDKRGLYPEFETPDGKLPLDVLSQGTQSLIQWIAGLLIGFARHHDFPEDYADKPGILIIDEIDAHLHPSWQRRIIPAITATFPSLQVFCSTHSPLMLAGLKAGQIHLLNRDRKGRVTVSRNETDVIGWSTDEIVTGFLGVDHATDLETEQHLVRLAELRSKKSLTPKQRQELETLRETVNERLMRGPAMNEVDELAERLSQSMSQATPADKNKSRRPAPETTKRRRSSTSRSRRAKK